MSQKCKPSYRNLNTIKSYSEQKYATVQWCQQNCENDEWLRRQVEELRYLSPPAVRNKFKIGKELKAERSYGYSIVSEDSVKFSSSTHKEITIDHTNFSEWVDKTKTTVVGEPYTVTVDGKEVSKIKYVLPNQVESHVVEPVYAYFGTATDNAGYNSAWYVGFDKTKNFYLKPGWINNWKNPNIPSLARAQTFKVPTKGVDKNGKTISIPSKIKLESVDLQLEYNGGPSTSSSPLYVQIWTTYQGKVHKSTWDNKKKQVEYKYIPTPKNNTAQTYDRVKVYEKDKKGNYIYTDKKKKNKKYHWRYEEHKGKGQGDWIKDIITIAKPYYKGSGIYKPLAEYVYNPQSTNKGGFQTMAFPNPPTLKTGKSYAIVLFSPLNNWDNCPRWAGWGRNCKRDKLYADGDAFISTDNGRSWKRYGKNDATVKEYKQGKFVPQDYRFQCKVETKAGNTTNVTVYEEGVHYLTFKPIFSNPIHTVHIAPEGYGSESSVQDSLQLDYQLSVDGKTWIDFPENYTLQLEEPSKIIFIRAVFSRTGGTANQSNSPYLEAISIHLDTEIPDEMYVRTASYTPPLGHILGASLWGRVFTPFSTEPTVECTVEIIEDKESEESFDIVALDFLDEKLTEKGLDTSWTTVNTTPESRCEYLTNHPELLETLKYYEIYIPPYEMNGKMYNLSFAPTNDEGEKQLIVEATNTTDAEDETGTAVTGGVNIYPDDMGGIDIVGEVAYPVISCQLEPEDVSGHGNVQAYSEWYDYVFDYDTNQVVFHRDTLRDMVSGTLTVKYNHVFIKDLTNEEVDVHYDEEGIRSDGLILDYFKEKFVVSDTNIETRRIKLRVQPTDPIRKVYLYKSDADEGDEPIELYEDSDYTVDIYSHELVFEVSNTDGVSTVLSLGDVLEVVYTPYLNSDSISIGYHAKRENKDMQCYLKNYYIEYKV